MNINGIGIITSAGRGIEAQLKALTEGAPPSSPDGFFRVHEQTLKDPLLAKEARRADRFDRMAVLAGLDALNDAGLDADQIASTGLILATAQGPHVTTFRFLDDLINFKEKDVSPTLFSHSVHNAAASYLSLLAGIRGPTTTVTAFDTAFNEALRLAKCWLTQQRCAHVLVGAVDELGSVMEAIIKSRASFNEKFISRMGEGSVFFVVSQQSSHKDYGTISSASALNNKINDDTPARIFGEHPCQGAVSRVITALIHANPEYH
jgi:3-oxoacyl-[acyl-carrier-protein] synthase II